MFRSHVRAAPRRIAARPPSMPRAASPRSIPRTIDRRGARLSLGALALVAAAAAPVGRAAAAGPAFIVCDASLDRVVRLEDKDGSGLIESAAPGEVTIFYDDASSGPDLSTPAGLALGESGVVFLVDGGTLDAIIALRDENDDGDANDDGEHVIYYDASSPGPDLGTPNAIAPWPGGGLVVADDGRSEGRIIRLRDLDGDGSALGTDEWQLVYGSVEAEAAGLPVIADPEALAIAPDGTIYVADAAQRAIFALADSNGDGDALDAGEVVDLFSAPAELAFADPEALALGADGDLWATDEDVGTIYRMRDADGDGRIDAGREVAVVVDESAVVATRDTNDLTVSLAGELYALDGERDQIFRIVDLDGDGAALGEGEVQAILVDGERVVGTPSGIVILETAPPAPLEVHGVEPAAGPLGGGNTVAIAGLFPFEGVEVRFGATAAEIAAIEATRIECRVPAAAAAATVDVRVMAGGREAVLTLGYRYLPDAVGFVRGDANADGLANLSDAVFVLGFLFLGGEPPGCLDSADIDDDGELSISDPIGLLGHLFIGASPPPPPYPDRGADPTDDALGCEP